MKKNAQRALTTLSLGTATLLMASTANAIDFKVNETDVDIYGYAKLDMIYDVDANLNNAIIRGNIRMDDEDGADGHTTMSANQSRIGFTTLTLIDGEVLKTNIEGDFYGGGGFTGGGGEFRLRHAYGVWNGILAGQTWSNFGNILSLFPTVDFNGPLGQGGGRQAQVRYTTGGFSFSVEDPEEGGGIVNSESTTKHRIPDLTVRYQDQAGPVNYAVAGLARFLEYDAEGSTVSNPNMSDDSATAWGVMLEANTQLTDGITLRGSVTHGDGIGGYLYLSPAQAAYVDGQGNLETIEATGGGVSISVNAGPGAVNFGYGMVVADLDDAFDEGGVAGTADEKYASAFLNYIWSPVDHVTYGLEAGHHTAEQVDGQDGDAVRLQAMVMYDF